MSDEAIKSLFNTEEFEKLKKDVSEKLIPRLAEVRENIQNEWSPEDDDAEQHMQQFDNVANPLADAFSKDQSIIELIEDEKAHAQSWVDENYEEPEEIESRPLDSTEAAPTLVTSRNIFDDIDEIF